jgi:hypothetical protein
MTIETLKSVQPLIDTVADRCTFSKIADVRRHLKSESKLDEPSLRMCTAMCDILKDGEFKAERRFHNLLLIDSKPVLYAEYIGEEEYGMREMINVVRLASPTVDDDEVNCVII